MFLTSYALDSSTFREHGPVRTTDGDRLLFAESLVADDAGTLYSSGWVECRDRAAWARDRAERAIAASGECRGETYRMMLLQIPRGAR